MFSAALPPTEAFKSFSDDVTKACWRTFSRYHKKLSANENLHCTDYEMVGDRNFCGCFTPSKSSQFKL